MTPRRTFLTSTAAVAAGSVLSAAAVPASGAVSPDAELIAACAEFSRLDREFGQTDFGADPFSSEADHAEAEQDRICRLMDEVSDRIVAFRATTSEGHQARARCLLSWAPELADERGCMAWRMRAAVLRDLAGSEVLQAAIQRDMAARVTT